VNFEDIAAPAPRCRVLAARAPWPITFPIGHNDIPAVNVPIISY
jgi:hypothetical protein